LFPIFSLDSALQVPAQHMVSITVRLCLGSTCIFRTSLEFFKMSYSSGTLPSLFGSNLDFICDSTFYCTYCTDDVYQCNQHCTSSVINFSDTARPSFMMFRSISRELFVRRQKVQPHVLCITTKAQFRVNRASHLIMQHNPINGLLR
jgi:hypothetical protein